RPHVGGAGGERSGSALGRLTVAGEVGGQCAIASAERRDRPPPALPGLGEPVEEDESLHAAIMTPTDTYLGLRAFVDELVRCGLREAVTSPGSRSTPLVLSLAWDKRLRASSHVDERSAAFFALGVAKTTGTPAALACTSGTAAANYLPAVIEA